MEKEILSILRFMQEEMKETNKRLSKLENTVGNLDTKVDKIGAKVDNLEVKVDKLESKVDNLEVKVDKLETKVDNLEKGQKEIKALIQELDPKNANRHIELKESIEDLRKDLTNVEIITSSNWNEIAKLKKTM